MRRLLPEPADDLSVAAAYAEPLGAHPDRPWIGMCMVASIDGSTVVGGTSAGLSNPTDGDVVARLRSIADVIIVGAGTVRSEGYGAPSKAGQRVGVVTRSASLDLGGELFASGAGFLITSVDNTADTAGVDVVRAGAGTVDLGAAVRQFPRLLGRCAFVQAEGGAALNGALFDADLFDELNVTTSAAAVGGDGPRLASGADRHRHRYELGQLCLDEEWFVYSRWRRRHP
jgi:riboflavin biosynthesis pyrimidine reductase